MQQTPTQPVVIMGAGAWGTALAKAVHDGGTPVLLWARNLARAGTTLPAAVTLTDDVQVVQNAAAVLLATPAQTTRAMLALLPHLPLTTPLVLCSKGLCLESGLRLDVLVHQQRPTQTVAYLSGPNFAAEVLRGVPTAGVIAAPTLAEAEVLCRLLGSPLFRLYANDDMVGVGLLGALKNVLALGAGVIAGAASAYNLGENTRAAFITRGLAEITRLGLQLGAKPATFSGLAGIGDILLSCSSPQSRNYRYGFAFGAGTVPDATMTVEGLPTLAAVQQLATNHLIEMPLAQALYDLFYQQVPLSTVLQRLLERPQKAELY